MNIKTQKITFGAMIVAIFAVILLLNRQTGDMFESLFFFLFPIPMVAYSAKYGLKSSFAVFICTIMCTMLFGTITTAFYAITQALVGLVYGTCLYHKKDPAKTILLIMFLCGILSIASLWVTFVISGIPISQSVSELKVMMNTYMNTFLDQAKASGNYDDAAIAQLTESFSRLTSDSMLTRIVFISTAGTGILQGAVIYMLSSVILRRLRFSVPKAQPLQSFYPPEWTGIVALGATYMMQFTMVKPLTNEVLNGTIETVGICCSMYLLVFGVMAISMFLRRKAHITKGAAMILTVLLVFVLYALLPFAGCAYISLGLHRWLDRDNNNSSSLQHDQ